MIRRSVFIGLWMVCWLSACASPPTAMVTATAVAPGVIAAAETATATPTVTATLAITPTLAATLAAASPTPIVAPTAAPAEWVVVQSDEHLALHPSWRCLDGIDLGADRLVARAGDHYLTVINEHGPYVTFQGDLMVEARMETAAGQWGALVLLGALPQGDWWQAMKRLDLGLQDGRVDATFWDGRSPEPRWSQSWSAQGVAGPTWVGLRKQSDQLLVMVNGREVGRLDDPGLFPQNSLYLGLNVQPNDMLTVYEIRVQTEKGKDKMVEIISPQTEKSYVPSSPSLRELAAQRGLLIGAAVSPGPLRCEPAFAQALAHEFNLLTTENAVKFGPVHPQPDRYFWDDADALVAFAQAHEMQVRGHTLVWHQQLAGWVEQKTWTRDEMSAMLREHIFTVVGRYRGRIAVWDVVNEALEDGAGRPRETVWYKGIGPDYLDLAFQWAHEADPDALLFYNDYNAEGMNRKSNAVYDLVKGMLERGVPIHGVGLQMHIEAARPPSWKQVGENMARLNALGLQVHITELDVRIEGQPTADKLRQQAEVYRDALQTCLDAPACTAFIMWGFTDRYSWVPGFFQGSGAALPFDADYQPKPAFEAMRNALTR